MVAYTTTIAFSVEMVMKVIAFGLIFSGQNAYLRNPTNILDFFITIFSVLSMVVENFDVSIIKVLRLFKILRPLRFISRIQAFNIAIQALSNAIFNVVSVLIISMLFFMIFAILGVNYFKGQFSYCLLDHTQWQFVREETAGIPGPLFNKWDCYSYGGEWQTRMQNFDNIVNAMMTLFQMATLSDWLNVMYDGMSITGQDNDFVLKSRPYTAIFFVLFVIVGAFFTLNLFVGVVISTYNREKEKIAKDFLLRERQKEWLYAKQVIFRQKLTPLIVAHKNKFRNWMLRIYKSPKFQRHIMSSIVLNTVILAIKYSGQPIWLTRLTETLNYLFTAFFTLEAIVNISALGKLYFQQGWNIFDFLIIGLTYVFILIDFFTPINFGDQGISLLRSFRILRVFKYFKATKSLKVMFNTFVVTLPAVGSIGGLLGLLIYVYAVLGVNLFAQVKQMSPLDSVQTFQGFGQAYLILIKIATGDGWAEIMNIMGRQKSVLNQCIESPSYKDYVESGQSVGCGSFKISTTFFYSYLVIVKLVFLNLFIAVILEGFDAMNVQESRVLNSDVFESFREIWQKFDPDATGFISKKKLPDLLREIANPLGFVVDQDQELSEDYKTTFITSLRLPSYHSFRDYFYVDVILALCKRIIVIQDVEQKMKTHPNGDPEYFRANIIKELRDLDMNEEMIDSVHKMKKQEKRFTQNVLSESDRKSGAFTQIHEEAARRLIQHLRNFVRRRKIQNGHQVRRYTKQELDEIEKSLMHKFKRMIVSPLDDISPNNVKDGVPELLKISINNMSGQPSQEHLVQKAPRQRQSSNSRIIRVISLDPRNDSLRISNESSDDPPPLQNVQPSMVQAPQLLIIEDDFNYEENKEQDQQEMTEDHDNTGRLPLIIPHFRRVKFDSQMDSRNDLDELTKDFKEESYH